jgi:hypothetical protein
LGAVTGGSVVAYLCEVPRLLLLLAFASLSLASGTAHAQKRIAIPRAKETKFQAAYKKGRQIAYRASRKGAEATVTGIGGAADKLSGHLAKQAKSAKKKKGKKSAQVRALKFASRAIGTLLGTETLRQTAFSFDLALVLSVPGTERYGNANAFVGFLAPSLHHLEKGLKNTKLANFGVGVETAIGGLGWNRWSGKWMGANLPYVAPWVGERRWGVDFGLPFFANVGFGHSRDLGPYVSSSARLPLNFLPGGIGFALGGALYYPPLEPLINKVRPYAERIQKKEKQLFHFIEDRLVPIFKRVPRTKLEHRRGQPVMVDDLESAQVAP